MSKGVKMTEGVLYVDVWVSVSRVTRISRLKKQRKNPLNLKAKRLHHLSQNIRYIIIIEISIKVCYL